MKGLIKVTSGVIRFYDGTNIHFSSLEQLLGIVSNEYEKKGLAEIIRIEGLDDEGKAYRLGLDFSNFQVQEDKTGSGLSKNTRRQKFLGQVLLEIGVITAKQLETAIQEQSKAGYREKIGEVLIRLGYCNAEQILYALAKQLGIFEQSK